MLRKQNVGQEIKCLVSGSLSALQNCNILLTLVVLHKTIRNKIGFSPAPQNLPRYLEVKGSNPDGTLLLFFFLFSSSESFNRFFLEGKTLMIFLEIKMGAQPYS